MLKQQIRRTISSKTREVLRKIKGGFFFTQPQVDQKGKKQVQELTRIRHHCSKLTTFQNPLL
jgi:hypothetical protein